MQHTTTVDKTEDSLLMILDKVKAFRQENLLEALQQQHYDEYDVKVLLCKLRQYHARLDLETVELMKFARTFNNEFATDDNTRFVDAGKVFELIHDTISNTASMYKEFCQRITTPLKDEAGKDVPQSVFVQSTLASGVGYQQMFGLQPYPPCVKMLCEKMNEFFGSLCVGLQLCHDVMHQEDVIRHNDQLVMTVYSKSYEAALKKARPFMDTLRRNMPLTNALETRKQKSASLTEFVSSTFHTVTSDEFDNFVVFDSLMGELNVTAAERKLWGDDMEQIKRVRWAIAHFDELDPKGYKDASTGCIRLSGKHVAMLMQWCGVTGQGNEQVFVENVFNVTYNGKYQTIRNNSVNYAKKTITADEYQAFKALMDDATRNFI